MAVVRIITLLGNDGDPVEYTIADGTAIPKGTIMQISASNLAAAATTDGEFIAGIANAEKKLNDGVLKMACITHCIADMDSKAAGSMNLGAPVKIDGANTVDPADDNTILNCCESLGQALETVGAAAPGAVLVNL
jgi:hypothetical protein